MRGRAQSSAMVGIVNHLPAYIAAAHGTGTALRICLWFCFWGTIMSDKFNCQGMYASGSGFAMGAAKTTAKTLKAAMTVKKRIFLMCLR